MAFLFKPSNTLRANSTVLVNDPHLSGNAVANAVWFVRCYLLIELPENSGGFVMHLSLPTAAGALIDNDWTMKNVFGGSQCQFDDILPNNGKRLVVPAQNATLVRLLFRGDFIVKNGASSGVFGVAWGQAVSSPIGAQVNQYSYLRTEVA